MSHTVLRPILMVLLIIMLLQPKLSQADSPVENWSVSSGAEQAVVVELFTSQGCSSCPPADRWLSQLKQQPALFSQVVPVAYHVTYWDYLGWQDPYGQAANDIHHRRHAKDAGAGVYTPGVFLQGREWRSWRRTTDGIQLNDRPTVGVLHAKAGGKRIDVEFTSQHSQRLVRPELYITYLRNGQVTQVRAGENRGRSLQHDFIATDLRQQFMRSVDGTWRASLTYPKPDDAHAVALWVVDAGNQFIQATGGFLPTSATAQR